MIYQSQNNVICFGDPKQAALYFDRVIPLNISNIVSDAINTREVFSDLLNINDYKQLDSCLVELMAFHSGLLNTFETALSEDNLDFIEPIAKNFLDLGFDPQKYLDGDIGENIEEYYDFMFIFLGFVYMNNLKLPHQGNIQSYVNNLSKSIGIKQSSVILPSQCLSYYNAREDDITLSIANIPIVNTQYTSWNKIIEFRKDKESKNKLRNLRLFLHTNYERKSRAFIEDDIEKRLDDYYYTCKNYEFETITSTLSTALDSKNLQFTIVASAGAAIWGKPIVAAGTILTGAVIELGKILIELCKKKHAFHKIKQQHELAYIIDAKKYLE